MLGILQRVQQQQDAEAADSASEDDSGGDEEARCELSEATLAKLLLRVGLSWGAV